MRDHDLNRTRRKEPGLFRATILTVLVHAGFAALLFFGLSWKTESPDSMEVEIWSDLPALEQPVKKKVESLRPLKPLQPVEPESVNPEPIAPKPVEPIKPIQPIEPPEPIKPVEPVKPEPVVEAEPPVEQPSEPVKPQPDVTAPIPPKKPAIALEQAKRIQEQERIKAEKLKQAAEEKKKQEQAALKKQQAEQELARKKQEKLKKERAAQRERERIAEQKRLEQAERVRQQAAEQARVQNEIAQFRTKILAKIKSRIVRPPDIPGNPVVEFDVTVLPGGDILDARLLKSSGHESFDQAVERAIFLSKPLPLPDDPALFSAFRNLNIKAHYQE